MIEFILHSIYVSDISIVIIATLIAMLLWPVLAVLLKRQMRILSSVVAVLSVMVILYATVFSRGESSFGVELFPFASFIRAFEQPEAYRSMFMNLVLFVPIGLSLPFVFRGKISKKVLLTVLFGFVLSVTIEMSQYLFALGFAETDDIICNTLGTIVGGCDYLILKLWCKD